MAPTGLHGFKNNPHAEQPNTESGPEVLAAALKEYGCADLIGLALENFVADFEHGRDAVIRRRHGYMGNIAKAKRLLTEYESKALLFYRSAFTLFVGGSGTRSDVSSGSRIRKEEEVAQ